MFCTSICIVFLSLFLFISHALFSTLTKYVAVIDFGEMKGNYTLYLAGGGNINNFYDSSRKAFILDATSGNSSTNNIENLRLDFQVSTTIPMRMRVWIQDEWWIERTFIGIEHKTEMITFFDSGIDEDPLLVSVISRFNLSDSFPYKLDTKDILYYYDSSIGSIMNDVSSPYSYQNVINGGMTLSVLNPNYTARIIVYVRIKIELLQANRADVEWSLPVDFFH